MLQRAASNAYSWWWASHIRTKQSKWLEQNLQDMEEKVQSMLKLIEEDGDSFAKRAEMYYKKRPELINFVEESYRAYRSLAERYDKISTELQNANNTIASVFPEQVQLAMEDEDEYGSRRVPKNASQASVNNAPKVPKYPNRDLKGLLTSASKQLQAKKLSKASNTNKTATKSGLSKSEALEEIDKMQKEILALQTVKEFVKSSYESGLTKYWDIENRIIKLQETVFGLQDEFRVGKVIEDGEARTLMAEAALKSCEEALAQLQEKQERSTQEARSEFKKVEDAREKVKSLKNKFLPDQQADEEKPHDKDESADTGENPQGLNPEAGRVTQERQEMDALREKIKVHFEESSKESLSVTEMVVKIDDLVSKVISMETAVSSQTALIDRLKTENDDLQEQIQILEDDKATLIEGTNSLLNRLREMEEKLNRLQDLNQNVENQNNNLQTYFTEARCSLDHLSENLHCLKPDEELEYMESLQEEEEPFVEVKTPEELEKQEDMPSPGDGSINSGELKSAVGDDKNEQVLSMSVILQNYNDVKEKLSDVENKNRDSLFETTVQLRELSSAIAKRDEEIQSLRQKLNLLHEIFGENKDLKEDDHSISFLLDDRNAKPEAMDDSKVNGALEIPMIKKEEEEIKLILIDQPQSISPIQEKLRMNIEALLDENLDFWLRFSTSFHQIQKLKTRFQDLQAEVSRLKEKEKTNQEGSPTTDIKSDLRPIYKHLREIQTELTLWIEQSALLNDELQRRSSSLCHIQDKITQVLKAGAEEEMEFSNHEAAKFQGEILNMKRENSKVRQELQAGLDQVTALQHEIEKTLAKLNEEFGLAGLKNNNQSQLRNLPSRTRVPLGAFIFGIKPKKKTSIFACMHPRKFHNLRGAAPM